MNKEVNSQVRDTQYCSVTFIFILTSSLASWQSSLAYGKPHQKPRHQIWGRLSNRRGFCTADAHCTRLVVSICRAEQWSRDFGRESGRGDPDSPNLKSLQIGDPDSDKYRVSWAQLEVTSPNLRQLNRHSDSFIDRICL